MRRAEGGQREGRERAKRYTWAVVVEEEDWSSESMSCSLNRRKAASSSSAMS